MRNKTVVGKFLLATVAVVVSSLSLAGIVAAQTTTSHLYDNFSQPLLDPLKWTTSPACYTNNGQELECVRQIQNGHLHLAHRNFGNSDSDAGFQFGSSSVGFINPAAIKTISTDIVVENISEVSCAANPELGAAAHIDATFFNIGTGDPNDDVGGHIAFGRVATDPPGQLTAYGQISQGFNYFAYFPLGTLTIGTPLTATLSWDQPQHRFLASWTNRITKVKTQVLMPYTLSDTTPAVNPTKVLTANTFPANCTANPAPVYIEAIFDNVSIE